ncbi:hypothetical protein MD484_g8457, partial [Candolleomyces efflorescens]
MDRRIASAPLFSGLRRFPEGQGFKQWTGNDSKALMKVFLPAIKGLVPDRMIDEDVLDQINKALERFHTERDIFCELGIRDNFNLPRQHSLIHYRPSIQLFGAPNGLCSSITESKHIKAVKETWRRSSRNSPLGEMLLSNQRLDKLAAARVAFEPSIPLELHDPRDQRRTIQSTRAQMPRRMDIDSGDLDSDDEDSNIEEDAPQVTSEGDVRLPKRAASHYPRPLPRLSDYLQLPVLEEHIRRFLYDQLFPESATIGMEVDLDACPHVDPNLRIRGFHSATSLYHAPSDLSGIGGTSTA